MSKKNNDNIERFFRKAVQQYDTDFRESDWQKMEKMLDEQAATQGTPTLKFWKRLSIGIVSLALVSTGVYFLSIGEKSPASAEGSSRQMQAAAGKVAPQNGSVDNGTADGLLSPGHANTAGKQLTEKERGTEPPVGESLTASKNATSSDPGTSAVKPVPSLRSTRERVDQEDAKQGNNVAGIATDKSGADKNAAFVPLQKKIEHERTTSTKVISHHHNKDIAATPVESIHAKDDRSIHPEVSTAGSKDLKDIQRTSVNEHQHNVARSDSKNAQLSMPGLSDDTGNKRENNNETVNRSETGAIKEVVATKPGEGVYSSESGNESSGAKEGSESLAHEIKQDTVLKKEEPAVLTAEPLKEETAPDEREKTLSVPSRWNVALTVAPDFSMTNFGQMSGPGETFGLQIGYRLFRRITVSTGLLKSAKKYEGYGDDYAPPEGYWQYRTNGVVPDEVYGKCSILEIPLMMQYDVIQNDRSRIYVAGGVSTYLMTSESYTYAFETANPNAATGWSSDESSSYPFGIGHISAAYERNITPRLSLGVEPFLKVPFDGIGWARIELFTTGAYVNVRYRFFRKTRITNP